MAIFNSYVSLPEGTFGNFWHLFVADVAGDGGLPGVRFLLGAFEVSPRLFFQGGSRPSSFVSCEMGRVPKGRG